MTTPPEQGPEDYGAKAQFARLMQVAMMLVAFGFELTAFTFGGFWLGVQLDLRIGSQNGYSSMVGAFLGFAAALLLLMKILRGMKDR